MKNLFILFTLIFSLNVYAQVDIQTKLCLEGDSSFWYIWSKNLGKKIELNNVKNSQNKRTYRLWTDKQVIDVWIDKNDRKYGKITNWVEECNIYGETPSNRIFYFSYDLNLNQIEKIFTLIDSLKIDNIPDYTYIENWTDLDDYTLYIIENSNNNSYCFRTYPSPESQIDLKEAKTIQLFIYKTLEIIHANVVWADYKTRIPFECYVIGGTRVTCKPLSPKERKKYKRERKKYLRKHKLN